MTIKRLLTSEVEPGMVLANDIYDSAGALIVPKETRLDKSIIEKLEKYSIFIVKILEGYDDENVSREIVGYYEKISATKEFEEFEHVFNQETLKLRNAFNGVVDEGKDVDKAALLQGVDNILRANSNNNNMMDMLNCMRGYDDLTYVHCISVALVCNVMAGWLGMSKNDTDELTFAGLLHDIGKVKIPKQIITKPGKLTDAEYKIVKHHPRLGYEILKKCNVSNDVRLVALMHHERYDGTGYPLGYSGEKITKFARIVAIADVYDAMTANRVYREGMCPFEVIEHFQSGMKLYDPGFLYQFLEHTAQTYVSNKVQLNDGQVGKVAMINKSELGRPIVLVGDKVIDLSKNSKLRVVKMM